MKFIYFVQCALDRRRNGVHCPHCGQRMGDEATSPVKIGYAGNIDTRMSSMRTDCPYPLQLLASYATDDFKNDERHFHERFARYRLHGEWFRGISEITGLARRISDAARDSIARRMRPLLDAGMRARRPRSRPQRCTVCREHGHNARAHTPELPFGAPGEDA